METTVRQAGPSCSRVPISNYFRCCWVRAPELSAANLQFLQPACVAEELFQCQHRTRSCVKKSAPERIWLWKLQRYILLSISISLKSFLQSDFKKRIEQLDHQFLREIQGMAVVFQALTSILIVTLLYFCYNLTKTQRKCWASKFTPQHYKTNSNNRGRNAF